MVGSQRVLKNSLQLKLSLWLAVAIVGTALIAGAFAFFDAFDEAHDSQDNMLRQMSDLFDYQHLPSPHYSDRRAIAHDEDADSELLVQSLPGPQTRQSDAKPRRRTFPPNLPDGMQTVTIRDESYRVMVKTLSQHERVAVAQRTAVRDEMATESALRTLTPFFILVPVLLMLVGLLARRVFGPIAELSSEIDRRAEQELHPLATESLPSEIGPFVVAINRLLARVGQSMEMQRRFVADAAHELRSPLTALSLQAERLREADVSDDVRVRLMALGQGIERSRALLEQLLSMARAQSIPTNEMAAISLNNVYRRVLEQLLPLAEAKDIDMGVVSSIDACIVAREIDVFTLIKNLVGNAIRYTPSGGRIDLSVQIRACGVALCIEDSGPGIAAPERERVFDPFYRVLGSGEAGSGLGLAIVKTIADRMGAQVGLADARNPALGGLRVTVIWSHCEDTDTMRTPR